MTLLESSRILAETRSLTPYLNQLATFFLILFLGFLTGKIIGSLIRRITSDLDTDNLLSRVLGTRFRAGRLLATTVSWLIYALTVILAFNTIKATRLLLTIISALLLIALALSTITTLKDFLPNAIAGWRIKRKIKPGHILTINNVRGVVKEASLLETTMEMREDDLLVIPNSLFATNAYEIKEGKRKERRDGRRRGRGGAARKEKEK